MVLGSWYWSSCFVYVKTLLLTKLNHNTNVFKTHYNTRCETGLSCPLLIGSTRGMLIQRLNRVTDPSAWLYSALFMWSGFPSEQIIIYINIHVLPSICSVWASSDFWMWIIKSIYQHRPSRSSLLSLSVMLRRLIQQHTWHRRAVHLRAATSINSV